MGKKVAEAHRMGRRGFSRAISKNGVNELNSETEAEAYTMGGRSFLVGADFPEELVRMKLVRMELVTRKR